MAMNNRALLAGLFVTTALGSSLLTGHAFAQAASGAGAGQDLLGEVVVTATKQTDTVSRVPLSVSASTQKSLDQQGIRNVVDLARSVPALTVSSANTTGVASFTIRGITTGGSAGAATVGVYLDDTSVTKRQVSGPGGGTNNNGSPLPALFDLERVEVLRGPQGTLYGGSSEGGTVRFITPTPSLTTFSTYDRASVSSTKYGDPSYELGLAVGGPIIKDKLGMRMSVYGQHTGGYIDHVDPYQPKNVTYENSNKSYEEGLHLTTLWRMTENLSATFSLFMNQSKSSDGATFNLPTGTITTPARCTAYTGFPASGGNPRQVNCAAPAFPVTYTYPSHTYGPFNLAPFQTITPNPSPTKSNSQIPALTLQYDFPHMTVKSITSYFHDQSKSLNSDTSIMTSLTQGTNPPAPGCGSAAAAGNGATPGCGITAANPNGNGPSAIFLLNGLGQPVQYYGQFKVNNERRGISEELRFSSDNSGPFTWVAGAYYSYQSGKFTYINNEDYNLPGLVMFGLSTGQRFAEINQDPSRGAVGGACTLASFKYLINAQGQQVPNPGGTGSCIPQQELANNTGAFRYQNLKDTEVAGFGEASYKVTDKLKVIGGLRISRVQFTFFQSLYGINIGYNDPTAFNQGVVSGTQTESPILPKVGLQYQFDDRDQVYLTASKGFRPGGVNTPVSAVLCTGLAAAGLTPQDIPATYNADTVWSYEGGAKVRLFGNRLAINSSVYRIDWKNVQVSIPTTGCGQTYNLNAGAARSQGFDLEAQAQLFRGFTVGVTAGYDDAKYTTTTTGPKPISGAAPTVVLNAGDHLAVPPWTVNLSGQYNMAFTEKVQAYIRADYRFTSKYQNTAGPGSSAYSPDTYFFPKASNVNARIGVTSGPVDVNVFANNLFNSTDYLSVGGGRAGCNITTGAACSLYSTYNPLTSVSTFRPREVGLQVIYRH
jgi:iron complex outermembrane receptor protein